jgi:hypothetical protein
MSRIRRTSFIVRVVEDGRGSVSGVIERVATGVKEAFRGMEAIGEVIHRMLRRENTTPEASADTPAGGPSASSSQPRRRRP